MIILLLNRDHQRSLAKTGHACFIKVMPRESFCRFYFKTVTATNRKEYALLRNNICKEKTLHFAKKGFLKIWEQYQLGTTKGKTNLKTLSIYHFLFQKKARLYFKRAYEMLQTEIFNIFFVFSLWNPCWVDFFHRKRLMLQHHPRQISALCIAHCALTKCILQNNDNYDQRK